MFINQECPIIDLSLSDFEEDNDNDHPQQKTKTVWNSTMEERYPIINMFNIEISHADLQRVETTTSWLNDSIIEFYAKLLMQKDHLEGTKSYYFSSFWLTKLHVGGKYNFLNCRRWLRRLPTDILLHETLYFPIHKPGHWVLIVVLLREYKMFYLDSMGESGQSYLKVVFRFLSDISQSDGFEYMRAEMNWIFLDSDALHDLPQQENGYDCGMFVLMFMRAISRRIPLVSYTQQSMAECRQMVAREIRGGNLIEDLTNIERARNVASSLIQDCCMHSNITTSQKSFYRYRKINIPDPLQQQICLSQQTSNLASNSSASNVCSNNFSESGTTYGPVLQEKIKRQKYREKIKQLEQDNVLLREERLKNQSAKNKKTWEKTKQLEQDNVLLREERFQNQSAKNKKTWEKTKQLEQDNVLLREERLQNQSAKNKKTWEKTKQLEQDNVLLREERLQNQSANNRNDYNKKKQNKSEKTQCSARQDTIDSAAGKPVVKHK